MSRHVRQSAPKPTISAAEKRFLEDALSSLPTGPSQEGTGFAEELQRYNYHQNPYLRAFARVLLSGYALARGQVADCHARFKAAHRDAELAGADAVTVDALLDASSALERAMAPDGSMSLFLEELRDRTLQRLWARVCETSHLPPPSFSRIFAQRRDGLSSEELDAEEEAAIAALMLVPASEQAENGDDDDDDDDDDDGDRDGDDGDGDDDDDDDDDDNGDGDDDDDDDDGDDDRDADAKGKRGGGGGGRGGKWETKVERAGNPSQLAELTLAAAADLLARARSGAPSSGALRVEIKVSIAGEGESEGGGRRRRRRRRRRS